MEWMTTKEVGEMLRRHPKTINRLVRAGKLRGRKIESPTRPVNSRSHWLIERASVEEFLESNSGGAAPVRRAPSPEAAEILRGLGVVPLMPHGRYGPGRKSAWC